ncbi:MAG: cation-translocating P-type ATPase [Flavobacteriia bacterium]|jgi:Ca2+-transporting ATPase
MKKGLSTEEANRRFLVHGPNELPMTKSKSVFGIVKEVLREPMFLLLISSATLYIILGDLGEGIILFSTISIIILITFFQHKKTEKALEALRNLSSPRVLVERDGEYKRIPSRELVVGDLVTIHEGDRIAADGKICEAFSLEIDESVLTGEALAVQKQSGDQLFGGTLVTRGRGILEIETTGIQTAFGKIGHSLNSIKQQPTKLQAELGKLIKWLGFIGLGLCIGVVLLFYFTRGDFLQALLNGLSAAMAILPEEFPVVMTVFLALGAWRLSKSNVLTRRPSAIETLGSATILCSDKTGTITCNKMTISAIVPKILGDENQVVVFAQLACLKNAQDPMERAIQQCPYHEGKQPSLTLIREYPFSHKLTATTLVYRSLSGQIIACKGAPETLIKLCGLNEKDTRFWQDKINELAKKGMRILGIAEGKTNSHALPESQEGFNFTFLGLIALADPVRPEVPAAIQECRNAGIRIIMLTGDHPETACSIGAEIGLIPSTLLIGSEIDQLNAIELKDKLLQTEIIARLKPEQKLRIVQSLQSSNEVVAMTGDGVNDAPALKAADIGVAMGLKGTDVAREAASLVLLDDNFSSIVHAIRSGRKIYDNLQKAMSYVLAIHIPIIGLTLLPAFAPSVSLILLPLHIVFMELIIDPVSSIAFESESEEKNIMNRQPRAIHARFFGKTEILRALVDGALLLGCVIILYFISKQEGHSESQLRSIAFIALVSCNLLLVMSKLSMSRSIFSIITSTNTSAKFIFLLALLLMITVFLVPSISTMFHMTYPGHIHVLYALLTAVIFTVCIEALKAIRRNRISTVLP